MKSSSTGDSRRIEMFLLEYPIPLTSSIRILYLIPSHVVARPDAGAAIRAGLS